MKKIAWGWRIWGEGRWIDVWSINHLLSGSLLAGGVYLRGDNLWVGLGVAFLVMLAWEVFEVIRNIHETLLNRVLDLVIGMIGFLVTIDLFRMLDNAQATMTTIIVLLVFFVFEIWGYLAYRFRSS